MNSSELSRLVVGALEEVKGKSVSCLNVEKLTQITDYMVIATGTSNTHVKALAEEVVRQSKHVGIKVQGVEGLTQSEWVLVDLGSVVVHIMQAPVRALYDLEELWNFSSTEESK
ncbi:MAG: ribosome silencing factor [Pseudohongiellaceae bacterium]